ncbi:MAG: hypothetical protein AAF799_27575 [Myxococcota bacterium]
MFARPCLVSFASLLCCCAPGRNIASETLSDVDGSTRAGSEQRCSVRPSQKKPLIVEWAAVERGALEQSIQDGLIVVRYVGCEMEVLRDCRVQGEAYGYRGFTPKSSVVTMRTADELYAQLPTGAARLEGSLERIESFSVELHTVGMYRASSYHVERPKLSGRCGGATHVVTGIQVGAYGFFANQAAQVAAKADTPAVGVGASTGAQRDELEQDGDPSKCGLAEPGDDAPPAHCGAPLRLEVEEIVEVEIETALAAEQDECEPGDEGCSEGEQHAESVATRCPSGQEPVEGRGCVNSITMPQKERPRWPPPMGLGAAAEDAPSTEDALLDEASGLLANGGDKRARALFSALVTRSPKEDRPRIELLIGKSFFNAGQYRAALQTFGLFGYHLTDTPQTAEGLYYAGLSFFRRGECKNAAAAFRVAATHSSASAEVVRRAEENARYIEEDPEAIPKCSGGDVKR